MSKTRSKTTKLLNHLETRVTFIGYISPFTPVKPRIYVEIHALTGQNRVVALCTFRKYFLRSITTNRVY
ncbi:hypothetical protein GCM10010970_37590 [Silvimonas iriomotensis]|uniref:Uncharacterized protein n=1 Tax=Silvimonas iriomotensis TaxID=449662 RepID=A0ABQ2PEY7_9NEIS|nr:hypothetical protein GCM10010970_37590 [Silvimonas iriomotensis]